ncbi:hypothetical protein [uncultured Salipiger sp.]|uniref:hypothetical protein n=1 Tax=uncultured Salipiger sp. TaxID=499810 RepID=UPI0025936BF5|nr:hypothetical protein [uncultured Salipiger sp.]
MNACITAVNHSNVKVEEKKRKAIFLNKAKAEYKIGRIDGCLINDGTRADYFVSGDGTTVLVELKGCDIKHACDQLFAAADHEIVKPHLESRIGFLIICSRYPAQNTSVQRAMALAKKKYKAKFFVFTNKREVTMSMF